MGGCLCLCIYVEVSGLVCGWDVHKAWKAIRQSHVTSECCVLALPQCKCELIGSCAWFLADCCVEGLHD